MEQIIKDSKEFVVLDIETSGFHPSKGGEIIEVGAVKVVDDRIVDKRNQLIQPRKPISRKITELTGISNDMLLGKQRFEEVLPRIYKFLGNATVVAHNSEFDWNRFLIYYFGEIGIYPKNNTVDTLTLSKRYIESSDGYSLEALCDMLNIKNENTHRALDDALATTELFLYIKKSFIDMDEAQVSIFG